MLDWSNLKPFEGSTNKSLEKLCYCLASLEFKGKGTLFSVDDSGGGDGVEFFLELNDGNEYGWQAKFYPRPTRLGPSRKKAIIDSIKKSILVHPKLKRFYLCINSELTPDELIWWKKIKEQYKKRIKLIFWGTDHFISALADPKSTGIENYFFGKLELSIDWFQIKLESNLKVLKDKYNEHLHVQDSTLHHDSIDPLLVINRYNKRLNDYLKNLTDNLGDFENALSNAKKIKLEFADFQPILKKYFRELDNLHKEILKIIKQITSFVNRLSPENSDCFYSTDPYEFTANLRSKKETAINDLQLIKEPYFGESQLEFRTKNPNYLNQIRVLDKPLSYVGEVIDEIRFIVEHSKNSKEKHLYILGDAGVGKTHIAINLVQNRLKSGIPALFLPGTKFGPSSDIKTQILQLLDIPRDFSFNSFIKTLDVYGEILNCRIPIVIDGINESVNEGGGFNKRWKYDLPDLISEIESSSYIVLILTCRRSYKTALGLPDTFEHYIHTIHQMSHENTKELVLKYFDEYKIKCELTYLSFQQFSNPLFLKIFCETTNPDKQHFINVTIGTDTIFDLFERLVAHFDLEILKFRTQVLSMPPIRENSQIATDSLPKIAKYLWENNGRSILQRDLLEIIDPNFEGEFNKTKTKALQEIGLLFVRDWYQDDDWVTFTYELLGGYLIAKYIYSSIENKLAWIKSFNFQSRLLDLSSEKIHPLHENILECFSSILLLKEKKILIECLPVNQRNGRSLKISVDTIFSSSGSVLGQTHLKLVENLFSRPENRVRLFQKAQETYFDISHPLNFSFWANRLRPLNMNERDISWGEYLRESGQDYVVPIFNEFLEIIRSGTLIEQITEKRSHLVAEYAMWTLSSTNKVLRDIASKCLYYYGRSFQMEFMKLFRQSLSINDPYIFERMAGVAYGIVLVIQPSGNRREKFPEFLPELVKFVFKNIFSKAAKFDTYHILTRDYCLQIVLVGISIQNDLLSESEMELLYKRPRASQRKQIWKFSKDRNENEYSDGNSFVDYYFIKKKLHFLVPGFNEYHPNKESEIVLGKIRNRAYELGYNFEIFGNIDKVIVSRKGYGGEFYIKTEKYGEKYINIAFFEFAGFLRENGTLPNMEDFHQTRFSEFDIDVTFPEENEGRPFLSQSYLNPEIKQDSKWLKKSTAPLNINDLVRPKLFNTDDWVILYCSFVIENKATNRNFYCEANGLMVENSNEKNEVILKKLELKNDVIPEQKNLFLHEVPNAPLFTNNGIWEISYLDKEKYEYITISKKVLKKNGKQLSQEDEIALSNDLLIKKGSPKQLEKYIVSQLNRKGITFGVESKRIKKRVESYGKLPAFIPNTNINGVIFLAKEIVDFFSLIGKPQETNLYERNGKLASTFSRYKTDINNFQDFHFFRKDLLDTYLKAKNLSLYWNQWGERQVLGEPAFVLNRENIPHYNHFHSIIKYDT